MALLNETSALVVLAGCGLALLAVSVDARRHWDEPAGVSFSIFAYTLGAIALSGCVAFTFAPSTRSYTAFYQVGSMTLFLLPLPWLVFAMEYLGRDEFVRGRYLLVTVAPFLAFLVIMVWQLFFDTSGLTGSPLSLVFSLALSVIFFFGLGIVVVLSGLVLAAGFRHTYVERGAGASLALVAFVPVATQFGMQQLTSSEFALSVATMLPLMAVGWVATTGALVAAYTRFDVFDAMPATSRVGPDVVVAEMADPMVVVDPDETVLEVNPAAESTLGVTESAVVGDSLSTVLGHSLAEFPHYEALDLDTVDGRRQYEVTVSELTDQRDRPLGYAVVLHDATERRLRQQRLGVLNRTLRHNIRNDMSAVLSYAEMLADDREHPDGRGDPSALAEGILEGATDIVETSEKARELEELMALDRDDSRAVSLRRVIERVVDGVRADHDACSFEVDVDAELTVHADDRLLEPVLRNVVANAVEHNDADDPWVAVDATCTDETVVVRVADDGPGVPEHEREVGAAAEETPLQHSSGLGLWTVRWGVNRLGGTVDIADRDPCGTVVSIRLPHRNGTPDPAAAADPATSTAE